MSKIIMYDSPEAARIVTVTGWATKDGRFFGDNEHLARYAGSTHMQCDKSLNHKIYRKNAYCEECAKEKSIEKFNAMPVVQWDQETPLNVYGTDVYFFDIESLFDYCCDYNLNPEDLNLVLCEPNHLSKIDEDYWCDAYDDEILLPPEIASALIELNAAIEKHGKAVSWSPSNKRVVWEGEK